MKLTKQKLKRWEGASHNNYFKEDVWLEKNNESHTFFISKCNYFFYSWFGFGVIINQKYFEMRCLRIIKSEERRRFSRKLQSGSLLEQARSERSRQIVLLYWWRCRDIVLRRSCSEKNGNWWSVLIMNIFDLISLNCEKILKKKESGPKSSPVSYFF